MQAQRLVGAVARLSRVATGPFDVDELLRALAVTAAEALDVDAAGVMVRGDHEDRFVHATSEEVAPLERLQELLQTGPCVDSQVDGQAQVVADVQVEGRWPVYQQLAARLSVGALVSVPLFSRGRGWGALDLYRRASGPWPPDLVDAARALADVAASYVVMAHDRDEIVRAHEEMAHRAVHDELTGLPSRALLMDRLEHALAVAARSGSGVAVVFLDLDLFKPINDTYGHGAGDAVLVEVAHRLRRAVRSGDTLARLSGDEFVVVCEGLPGDEPDLLVARVRALTVRLRAELRQPMRVGAAEVVLTASIGAAVTHVPAEARDVLAAADAAMYAAKQSGRGAVVVREVGGHGAVTTDAEVERLLPGAVDRGELRVHYQPIVSSSSGGVVAVESLVRWRPPDGELLDASRFVDLAVRTGAIAEIGRWVLEETCRQMASWRAVLDGRSPRTAFVNLSARELTDATLPGRLDDALGRHGLDADAIGLEIVEDHLADPAILRSLEGYRLAGHRLSVDDFGTGYSSLARLVDLPIDLAKMDKALVRGLPDDPRRSQLVQGVLLMASALGFEVVAEGVETAPQAAHLAAVGCHLLQGFHVGSALPGEELTLVLAGPAPGL